MYRNKGILIEAAKAKFQPNLFVLTVIILVLFFSAYMLPQVILSNIFEGFNLSAATESVSFLFLNIITIAAGILYCTKIEKRSLRSMGFVKKGIGKNYLIGLALGLLILFLTVITSVLLGAAVITRGHITPMVILFFLGFVVQGMSEEVALRGVYMVSAANKSPIVVAILINSLFFAIPHYMFSDGQLLFTINTLLMGILFSIYMLQTDNIWGVSGIHTGFNFFNRVLFNNSEWQDGGNSVFLVTSNIPGKELIGGNSYGILSGLIWTIFIVAFLIILVFRGKVISK